MFNDALHDESYLLKVERIAQKNEAEYNEAGEILCQKLGNL